MSPAFFVALAGSPAITVMTALADAPDVLEAFTEAVPIESARTKPAELILTMPGLSEVNVMTLETGVPAALAVALS